jgi:hypothetical protein
MRPTYVAVLALALALGLGTSYAQTAAVTATCKDGTPFSGTTRRGACRGHGGVQAANSAAPAASATPAASAAQAPVSSTTPTAANASSSPNGAPPRAAAAGQVWVNTASKVYHCPGDQNYGKTKAGAYMSEAAAKDAGDRPSRGKTCS